MLAFVTLTACEWVTPSEEKWCAAGLRHAQLLCPRCPWVRTECLPSCYGQCGTSCWQTSETRDTSRGRPRTIVPCLLHSHTLRSCVSLNAPQRKKTRAEGVEKLHWRGSVFIIRRNGNSRQNLSSVIKVTEAVIYIVHVWFCGPWRSLPMKSFHKYCPVTCLTIHNYVKFLQTIHKDLPFSFNSYIVFLSEVGCTLFLHSTINGCLGNFSLFL